MEIVVRTGSPGGRGVWETRRNRPCSPQLQRLDELAELGALAWQERMAPPPDAMVAELAPLERWAFDLGLREARRCTTAAASAPRSHIDKTTNDLKSKSVETADKEREMLKSDKTKTHSRTGRPRVTGANSKPPLNKPVSSAEGPPSSASGATRNAKSSPAPSKKEKILRLLRRPGGATLKELMRATGWQPHSVRGFLSATVGGKMGLKVVSAKTGNAERRYSVNV